MNTDTDIEVVDRRSSALAKLSEADITNAQLPPIDRAMVLRTPQAEKVALHLAEIAGRPLADRILVLPLPPDERYGSILFADSAKEDQCCGIVVAVGRGRFENGTLVPPEVRAGNYVSFSRYAARKVDVGGIEVFQVSECDISFAAGK